MKAESLERLGELLATVPFAGVYSQDNTLTFSLPNVDVTLENLLPEVFAARLAAVAKRAGNAFAHDALVFNPDTNELSDPFDARLRAVRLVNKTFGSVAALDVILRGTVEAAQLRLTVGTDFSNWKARVLRSIARSADAPKLAATFLQQLANLPAEKIESLVRSRLVATALKKVFGIRVTDAVAEFKSVRSTASPETTDAAIYHQHSTSRNLTQRGDCTSDWASEKSRTRACICCWSRASTKQ